MNEQIVFLRKKILKILVLKEAMYDKHFLLDLDLKKVAIFDKVLVVGILKKHYQTREHKLQFEAWEVTVLLLHVKIWESDFSEG